MNPDIIPLLLPPAFQLLVGGLSIAGKIRFRFRYICLISFFSQIVLDKVVISNFSDRLMEEGVRCGMPMLAYIMIAIIFFIILGIIIPLQLLARNLLYKQKTAQQT